MLRQQPLRALPAALRVLLPLPERPACAGVWWAADSFLVLLHLGIPAPDHQQRYEMWRQAMPTHNTSAELCCLTMPEHSQGRAAIAVACGTALCVAL